MITYKKNKNLIFSGSTSFTGFSFLKELVNYNLNIVCNLTNKKNHYKELKKIRLQELSKHKKIKFIENCKFGSNKYLELLKSQKNFSLCHHSSFTQNYNDNLKFDLNLTNNNNLKNIDKVFSILKDNCEEIILTESIFQSKYNYNLFETSKYSLSKSITSMVFDYYSNLYNIKLRKFIICNPWGSYEEKRFTYYLMNCWSLNKIPIIKRPYDIRENIYINDLSKRYSSFILNSSKKIYCPSGQQMSNLNFAKFLKSQLSDYLNKEFQITWLRNQKSSSEPIKIINPNSSSYVVKKKDLVYYFNYYGFKKKLS